MVIIPKEESMDLKEKLTQHHKRVKSKLQKGKQKLADGFEIVSTVVNAFVNPEKGIKDVEGHTKEEIRDILKEEAVEHDKDKELDSYYAEKVKQYNQER